MQQHEFKIDCYLEFTLKYKKVMLIVPKLTPVENQHNLAYLATAIECIAKKRFWKEAAEVPEDEDNEMADVTAPLSEGLTRLSIAPTEQHDGTALEFTEPLYFARTFLGAYGFKDIESAETAFARFEACIQKVQSIDQFAIIVKRIYHMEQEGDRFLKEGLADFCSNTIISWSRKVGRLSWMSSQSLIRTLERREPPAHVLLDSSERSRALSCLILRALIAKGRSCGASQP